MASNRLLANDSKTTFMMFGKRSNKNVISLDVGSAKITEQDTQKLLGLEIANDLKWDCHVEKLKGKLRHRLYVLRHLSQLLPKEILLQISDAIFNSQLRYCMCLFLRPRTDNSEPSNGHLNALQKLHNDMLRTATGVYRRDKINMDKLRKQYKVMTVNQMLCCSIAAETRKIVQNNTVPSLNSLFTTEKPSGMETRSKANKTLKPPKCRARKTEGFSTYAPRIFNKLPLEIKSSTNSTDSKRKSRDWIYNNMP